MPSAESFHFALLRVSILQILKSIGFDRASNRAVEIITDIYIRQLGLLLDECKKLALSASRDDVELQDVVQAMIDIGVIMPARVNDPFDFGTENYLGMRNFVKWLKSDDFARMQRAAFPSKEQISRLVEENPESAKSVSRLGNQKLDWFQYLTLSQLKVEYEEKMKPTIFYDEEKQTTESDAEEFFRQRFELEDRRGVVDTNHDCVVMGPTPEHLMELLPYKVQQGPSHTHSTAT